MAVDHNVLADILMQRMAQHAPVTQNCSVNGKDAGKWLVTWGHYSHEGKSRYEAVMGLMFELIDNAGAERDPRTVEVPDADSEASDDSNGPA